jgi:hypothetical protein
MRIWGSFQCYFDIFSISLINFENYESEYAKNDGKDEKG